MLTGLLTIRGSSARKDPSECAGRVFLLRAEIVSVFFIARVLFPAHFIFHLPQWGKNSNARVCIP